MANSVGRGGVTNGYFCLLTNLWGEADFLVWCGLTQLCHSET